MQMTDSLPLKPPSARKGAFFFPLPLMDRLAFLPPSPHMQRPAAGPRIAEIVGKIDHILTNAAGVARLAIKRLADDRERGRKPFENGEEPATVLDLAAVRSELSRVRDDVLRLLERIDTDSGEERQAIVDTAREAAFRAFRTVKRLEDADTSGEYKRGFSISLDVALERIADLAALSRS